MDSFASNSSHNVHSQEDIFQKKYKGVRRRKWGKWVSEIRVPGSQERLWLGSYTTPEAAAVAHDVASYCLRGLSSPDNFNFPLNLPSSVRDDMSPSSVRQAASDAGMAIDAKMIAEKSSHDHQGINNGEVLPMSNSSIARANINNSDVFMMRRSWDGANDHKMFQELWEDGAGDHGQLICDGKWEAREGEGLSISVDDYL